MNRKHLAPAAWLALAGLAFALGWNLKPQAADTSVSEKDPFLGTAGLSPLTALPESGTTARTHSTGNEAAKSAGGPLTAARLAALGDFYRNAKGPIERREAFAELIAGLTPENAREMRELFAHLPSDNEDFRDFHYAWGRVGGAEAVMNGAETREADMGATMAGWASANPNAAKAWFASLEANGKTPANQEYLKAGLVHGLADANSALATDFVMALGGAGDKRAKEMMSIVAGHLLRSGGTTEAASWAAALPAGDLRGHALFEVARAQVRSDPVAAAEWASTMARDGNAGSVAYGITMEWGWRDGPAAVQWLDSLGNAETASAYGPALGGWTKVDPLAASEYVAAMPPSEGRDHAIGGMVYTNRWEDPAAAILWANEISNADRRNAVLTLAAEAYVRKDPSNAADWLLTSGLPAETQQRLLGDGK
ncbi:MAG: hypothetical protein ACKV19_01190 [Verrucomicrobiales bacterium]